jgi:hypothetical protein
MTSPALANGYYLSDCNVTNLPRICNPTDACIGDTSGRNSCPTMCLKGYEGDGCSKCSSGYYRLNYKCLQCPGVAAKVLTILAIVLIALLLLVQTIKSSIRAPQELRVTIKAMQTLALFPSVSTKWPRLILGLLQFMSLTVSLAGQPFLTLV